MNVLTSLERPTVDFRHLRRLTDEIGLFEHAEYTAPRVEHGYCVDDVARGLVIVLRETEPSAELLELAELYLGFVIDAQAADGRFHNRRGREPGWLDDASLADCWGRALWGLGAAVNSSDFSAQALACFERAATLRSPWPKAMVFAALGAAQVLRVHPEHLVGRQLLADTAAAIVLPARGGSWRWPEPRLSYANAAVPEVLLAAGELLGDAGALADGLSLLSWLLETETLDGHLSVAPVGGWAQHEPRPGFDQQPIEVAALADACALAFELTGDSVWRAAVRSASRWFLGDNDTGLSLYDPVSRGGRDGLERTGCNQNQGAESTLAMISVFQQARRLSV
ncbi:MAG: putative glycosyltransferase [Frankiales bacterium]|nr:putative glycosyltransferase [Frankiales bacterium]